MAENISQLAVELWTAQVHIIDHHGKMKDRFQFELAQGVGDSPYDSNPIWWPWLVAYNTMKDKKNNKIFPKVGKRHIQKTERANAFKVLSRKEEFLNGDGYSIHHWKVKEGYPYGKNKTQFYADADYVVNLLNVSEFPSPYLKELARRIRELSNTSSLEEVEDLGFFLSKSGCNTKNPSSKGKCSSTLLEPIPIEIPNYSPKYVERLQEKEKKSSDPPLNRPNPPYYLRNFEEEKEEEEEPMYSLPPDEFKKLLRRSVRPEMH